MVEKAYRSMKTVGAGNIALGIIMAVVGDSRNFNDYRRRPSTAE